MTLTPFLPDSFRAISCTSCFLEMPVIVRCYELRGRSQGPCSKSSRAAPWYPRTVVSIRMSLFISHVVSYHVVSVLRKRWSVNSKSNIGHKTLTQVSGHFGSDGQQIERQTGYPPTSTFASGAEC